MKYFLFIFKHFWFTFFSYLCFPMECELCKKAAYFMPICPDCEKRLISEKIVNRCQSCGKELFFEKDLCIKCRNDDIRLQGFLSVYPRYSYVLQKKRLLYLWKVANNRSFLFFFAKAIFRVLQDKYQNIPVVPVPPRPNKIRDKGWDQIEDLVFILENKYKVKVLRILERITETQQKKLSKDERFSESKNSYLAKNPIPENLPEEVVLIDDVITTGATMNSCREILTSLGITKIHVVSLFIVP